MADLFSNSSCLALTALYRPFCWQRPASGLGEHVLQGFLQLSDIILKDWLLSTTLNSGTSREPGFR